MSLGIRYGLLMVGLAATIVRPLMAEITAEQVRESIERGADYLKSRQNRANGSWPEYEGQPGGLTALCTLALINSGVGPSDPAIQQALAYLESVGLPKKTYSAALQTMVFCAAAPEKRQMLIRRNVKWLEGIQITSGDRKGAWPYSAEGGPVYGDNSNTQFALLALHEAERTGVQVSDRTWRLALTHWIDDQRPDGCWRYYYTEDSPQPGTGSMTCAGIACVVIASGQVHERDAQVKDGRVLCCGRQEQDDAVERGLDWLGQRFSVYENPIGLSGVGIAIRRRYLHYYLYCLERVGRLTGRRFIGRHDWYREGADMLVGSQDKLTGYWRAPPTEDNPLVATSFALLFLSKGRRPVVIGKLKHRADNDWDLHRSAVQNLTKRVERQWRRDLTWQTIDAKAATVEDLLQAPVLFISGRQSLNLTHEQKANLRDYVQAGGFLFAEACCKGQAFDRTFRKLMQELFPESPLRLLPAGHAIWYAEAKVDPKYMRPLYGINACCRTSVVYCPEDLSCYWELSDEKKRSDYPQAVQDEIEACLRIGANVIAYATNRVLKEKLDRPQLARSDGAGQQPSRGVLHVPQLVHSGGGDDDAPNALPNLLDVFRQQLQQRVSAAPTLLTADDESIYRYPIFFMHGRRDFRFAASERKALTAYLEQGGFIFADAICASPQFAAAVRRELEAMFPDQTLTRIPTTHPLFTQKYGGYDLARVTLRDPQYRAERERLEARLAETTPLLEGLEIDGRLAFVFSPNDISCALENSASLECKGYVRSDAAKIGVNVILFALQQ